jgi:hypothetical protein
MFAFEQKCQAKGQKLKLDNIIIVEIPRVKTTTYGKNSFKYTAAVLWNDLPDDFRKIANFNQFKNILLSWNGNECKSFDRHTQYKNKKQLKTTKTCTQINNLDKSTHSSKIQQISMFYDYSEINQKDPPVRKT